MLSHRRFAAAFGFFWCLVLLNWAAAGGVGVAEGWTIDWPSYNNDLASDRYVDINQISVANAKRLHVICTAVLGGPTNFQTGPIVVGGVLYATRSNQTFALNAATCRQLWVNTYSAAPAVQQTRGIAYAGGLLFRGFVDGHVTAVKASNGATVWNTPIVAAGSLELIDAAPIAWNGIVFIGTANGEAGQVCHLVALDQKTGRVLWSQQPVPNLGTPAAATWKGATRIAGGAMWTSFTIDPTTGKLYVPVGNPGPDFDVRERLGINLYTESVAELDATTGHYERSMQFIPQDAHDWDQGATPAVVTLKSGAKVALVGGKDGYLRSVDAGSFALHWRTPITTIFNAAAPIVPSGTRYCPSGAILWNGPAFSPATGLVYVNASDWCTTIKLAATPQPYVPGQFWLGSSNGFGQQDTQRAGWLNAVDAVSGAVVWRYHASLPLVAGVTPTSGGVLFTADLLGNVLGFNAASGALLVSVPTHLAAGGGVISYEVTGKQYVAVAAGMSKSSFQTPDAQSSIVVLGL